MPDDAVRAVAGVAASQHGAISRRQAAEAGFDWKRVRTAKARGWLSEPVGGVLLAATTSSGWHQRLTVATLARRGRAVASHRAAARLHRLDGFENVDAVEVSVDRRFRAPVLPGVTAHHVVDLADDDVVEIDGIRCTSLARTMADLGAVVAADRLRRAFTDIRRRGVSLPWVRSVTERLHRPGPSGTARLLRLLDAVPTEGRVSESWFEELLAGLLADADLPEIVPQYLLRDARGRFVARLDLGIPEVRLGIEAHSRRFHFGPDAEPLDEDRDLRAAACGWELLYLGWRSTQRPAEVVAMVRDVVAARRTDQL